MQFSTIAFALLASTALSSAAVLEQRIDKFTDDMVKNAWDDSNMRKWSKGYCEESSGKCVLVGWGIWGTNYKGSCYTGGCGKGTEGQKCILTTDDMTRCPGGPRW